MRSRRVLDSATAKLMVQRRELRRIAREHALATALHPVSDAYAADTSATAGAVHDALLRRLGPSEKLAMVAQLSRSVRALARAGLRVRNPHADEMTLKHHEAELLFGPELAARSLGRRLRG